MNKPSNMQKKCIKCGEIKPLSSFEKRKDTGKYRNSCKACVNKQHQEYLRSHPETKQRQKEKREKDKSKHIAYYEKNKDPISDGEKICSVCKKRKPLTEFYYRKNEGHFWSYCKTCKRNKQKVYETLNADSIKSKRKEYRGRTKEHISEHMKQYWQEHRDERLAYQKKRYEENKEQILAKNKEYYELNKDKIYAQRKEYQKKWFNDNREKIYQNVRNRKESDPVYKIREQIRVLIRNSIRKKGYKKDSRTYEILGCDYDAFYNHLLQTFIDNYGYEWDGIEEAHIDHITPVSTAKTEDDVYKLCHYTNLQLLKAEDNLSKGARVDWNLKKEDDE